MSELEMEGYCFKCKAKRQILKPMAEWSASGSPGTRGTCSVCGGTIYKTGRTPAHEGLAKPVKPKAVDTKKTVAKSKGKAKTKATKKENLKGLKRLKEEPEVYETETAVPRSGKLVIVESPTKAKTIGKYLGRGYVVKSSVGHVRDLLKSTLSVDIEDDYRPTYRVPNEKRKLIQELTTAAAKAKEIFLATDPDREGEAIAWHVMESAKMNPNRTKRVVFHEITKPAIQAAFEHPRDIDMDRVDAQQARRILDRLVGYQLSPLLWRKVRGRLSAGRVQSVAVRLIVEREMEIEAFVVEEYWTIAANLSQPKWAGKKNRPHFSAKLLKFKEQDPVLKSEADVKPHLVALEKAAWSVGEVRLGKRIRRPAAPFTTSTLQQEASRRFNFTASKTMQIAQQLYEGVDVGKDGSVGLITYMRTDSVNVSTEAQAQAREYIHERFGAAYVPAKPPEYKTKAKSAQEAHEAVRPTAVRYVPKEIAEHLSKDQARLYGLIWERFVASQMEPAVYDTVSADVWAGDGKLAAEKRPYLFRATGSTLQFAGFLALYEETEPEDRPDGGENQVPSDLESGMAVDLLKLLPEQHFTQPPPRYTEATLVKTLEENGVGRPSTYASILSTVQKRGYVERKEKRLVPTDTGILVNNLLVEYFPDVVSTDFTARLEDELDQIAEGKNWVPVVDLFYGRFAEQLHRANEGIEKIDIPKEKEYVGRDCPLCGNPLVYREGRYGRFVGCGTFPKCRHTEQILVKLGVACPNDGGDLIEKRTRRGKTFFGCANYPACEWTSWKRPLPQPCQFCGGLIVEVNKTEAECTQCERRQPVVAPIVELAEL